MPSVRIPTPLRKLTNELEVVQAAGSTISEVIASLDAAFPGLKERICDDAGQVRRFVNIFVNDEDIRFLSEEELEALLRAVPDDHLGPTDRALYLTAALTGLRQGEPGSDRVIEQSLQAHLRDHREEESRYAGRRARPPSCRC